MASIVAGLGTSHSPLLLANPSLWLERAVQDKANPQLYDRRGVLRTYDELEASNGGALKSELNSETWERRFAACQAAMDRLASDLVDAAPDVLVIVGDDQAELFGPENQPAVAIFHGARWRTEILDIPDSPFFEAVAQGYAMDAHHVFDGDAQFALQLVGHLISTGFDLATVATTPAGRGFGHAYGFVVRRLLGDRPVRVIPLMLNTYYPPNQPTPARCYDLGTALRDAIERAGSDARVAVVASGGLSHFVVNEDLDSTVLDAIRADDKAALVSLPPELLNAGSSEIRNWIAVAGAMAGRPLAWSEYAPCYRSAAGTGCGMGFARWG
jgi:Catalytic LigB subunit of aromatic ring-opening dioxygenase